MPIYEQPRPGQRIAWNMDVELKFPCTVLRVEGNLCWCEWEDGSRNPFIWNFPRDEQMNQVAEVVGSGE